ncbi:hypothetical protein ABEW81_11310 [Priestia megaterium]
MPKKVILPIERVENENTENEKVVIEDTPFIIKKAKFIQLTKTMSTVMDIVKEAKTNENLKGLLSAFSQEVDREDEEELRKAEMDIISKAVEVFPEIAMKLPDQAIEILSALSRINKEVLQEQEVENILEVYDAVLEENNIQEIIERAKKSLALTTTKFNFKSLVEKATTQA